MKKQKDEFCDGCGFDWRDYPELYDGGLTFMGNEQYCSCCLEQLREGLHASQIELNEEVLPSRTLQNFDIDKIPVNNLIFY